MHHLFYLTFVLLFSSKGAPSKRHVLLHNIDILENKVGKPLYKDTFDTSVSAAIRVGDMKLITGRPGFGAGGWSHARDGFDVNVPGKPGIWVLYH